MEMILRALRDLDPLSAPRADDFTGAFYKRFKHEFAPVMYDIIRQVQNVGTFLEAWIARMTWSIPKEACTPAVDKLCSITFLNCKIKGLTGVVKIAMDYLVDWNGRFLLSGGVWTHI